MCDPVSIITSVVGAVASGAANAVFNKPSAPAAPPVQAAAPPPQASKRPDAGAGRTSGAPGGAGGPGGFASGVGSTLLTGPSGVAPGLLNLGKSTLLGQ